MSATKPTPKEQGGMNRALTLAGIAGSDRQRRAVRRERRTLMRADAVLRCVAVALEYDGWTADEPDYADAIGVARDLISQTIDRLEPHSDSSAEDSVRYEPESST